MSGAAYNRGASKQDYSTPPDFMRAIRGRFGKIYFDLAASPENAKSEYFFSEREDSLRQAWPLCGNLWLNPPFKNIGVWAAKCAQWARGLDQASNARLLFLVPASVGSNWFADFVWGHAQVIFLNGRISFDGKNPFPKDCMLCVYGSLPWEDNYVWHWKA